MEPRLARTVWVTPPGRAQRVRLPAGSTPPEWAWPLITNAAAWAIPPQGPVTAEPTETAEAGTGDALGPPPMHGKGSSKSSWASYAEAHGVQVAPESTRADIIAALDQANIRTV